MKKAIVILATIIGIETAAFTILIIRQRAAAKLPGSAEVRASVYGDFAKAFDGVLDSLEGEYAKNRIAQLGGRTIPAGESPALRAAREATKSMARQSCDKVVVRGKVFSRFAEGVMVDCDGEFDFYHSAGLIEWVDGEAIQRGWCSLVGTGVERLKVGQTINVVGTGQDVDAYRNKSGEARVVNRYTLAE
ncbi:MAG: hypothetical protein KIT22_07775 [Verrucomicrobiae bacterium]|nr:hypothetical protein [Verrucomicrobiae bacterium]